MKVFLTSAYPDDPVFSRGPEWLVSRAAPEDLGLVTDRPEEADVILFVEGHPGHDPLFWKVFRHPLARRHPDKVVLYHDGFPCTTLVPTLCPNVPLLERKAGWREGAHYVARIVENPAVDRWTPTHPSSRRLLASFRGSLLTSPVRQQLKQLEDPGIEIRYTSTRLAWEVTETQREAFVQDLADSWFGLCPRGLGPSSYRLFETMQLGRAPVIVSDEWCPVPGPDWDRFSIRVPESAITDIPTLLRQRQSEAIDMGRRAREAWERWFSPAASLRTLAELSRATVRARSGAAPVIQELFRPRFARSAARTLKHHLRSSRGKPDAGARSRRP